MQLTATLQDQSGNVLEGRTIEWASANENIAAVSEAGLVHALAEGQVLVSATAEGVTGSLAITVSSSAPPPPGSATPGLQQIAAGLAFPLYLTSPVGDNRLFIVQKGGAIRIIKEGALLTQPFLDLSGRVSEGDEEGLLGLAFPPDYKSTGRFFVHYTDLVSDTHVSLFRVSDDPDRADPASELVLLTVEKPGRSHNGGQLQFGPDGQLYVGLGDGGSRNGQDDGRGQSLDDLLASILRIDVSSGTGYSVPPDNPFVGTAGARGEIWSYGLRNPWRFSFDRANGDLYIADVGEGHWEEVNRGTASEGAGRGSNYGWSRMEGRECLVNGCDQTGLTLPLLQYSHTEGCAIIGGYVYRGAALPALQGQYFYADFCQSWVHSIPVTGDPDRPIDWPALHTDENITSFGEDAAGELYILTRSGEVLKIVPR
jgi:glucose/arabinose dehydrogenase